MLKAAIVPVTPFAQNCTILWDDATMTGAAVDPGGDIAAVIKAAEDNKVTLEKILLTHGHLDHAGGAAELKELQNLPIIGPERGDQFWLEGIEAQGKEYGFAGARSCVPDQWLKDGDQVTVGQLTLDVIHCPGHTPGHVVFYHEPSKVALVGDVLFQGSIGRTDFPKGNHADLIASIRNKLFPLGDDITFVSGHGPLSTFGQERETNPFVSDAAVSK
ncbi:MAG: hypothetical protein CMF31_01880 [Kordiimonas sp.]|nr:hypothetical protein [Kordiimonas sp.]